MWLYLLLGPLPPPSCGKNCSLVGALKLAGEQCPALAAPVTHLCLHLQDKPLATQFLVGGLPDFSSPANWNLSSMVVGFFLLGFFWVFVCFGWVLLVCFGFFCLFCFFFLWTACLSGNQFLGKARFSQQAGRWNHGQEVRLFVLLCTGFICEVVGGQHVCGMVKRAGCEDGYTHM